MKDIKLPVVGSRWVGRKGRSEVEVVSVDVQDHGYGPFPVAEIRVVRNDHSPYEEGKVFTHSVTARGNLPGYHPKEE